MDALSAVRSNPGLWCVGHLLNDVLDKLEFGPGERANLIGDKKEAQLQQLRTLVSDQLSSLDLIAVFCLSNYNELLTNFGRKTTKRITETFSSICSIQLEKNGISFLWHADDCVVVLSNESDSLINASQSILQKLERFNQVEDASERVYVQICLHQFNKINTISFTRLVNDLTAILQLSRLGKPVNGVDKSQSTSFNERILLSKDYFDGAAKGTNLQTRQLGGFRTKPWQDRIEVFELVWRNPIASIDSGAVRSLGRFEIIERILETERKAVYKARDSQLNRNVILKAVLVNNSNDIDPAKFEGEFLYQARSLGRLHHPNLAVVYDVGEDAGLLYTAREYLEGASLANKLKTSSAMSKQRLFKNLLQACHGIAYAHRMSILHGNLRPSNILIADSGDTKVADFNIPVLRQYLDSSNSKTLEQAYYLSPEHIQHQEIDCRTDIFLLGIIIYQLLTGETPFKGETYEEVCEQIISVSPPAPSSINDYFPDVFDEIALKALQKAPNDRYQDIAELEVDLQTALFSETLV